ncbi:uncharacterized protein BCR38DRAFT_480314 [Pseudomassariella vexata]|uniref:Extracellular membrane protein CFEM domain-containing protein n=1 Tax=Pseudomassariella vexata TaxID=1141098 RepID=A0A1Y2EJZ8_9PEZI|nr:uncharacterized protein BCR38DRAFT_480314 [Pseudomassariella vexata]ORY71837.1 hypothetical protein BCR38DRAFT_480314 [Pseudomassariella vexata]
MRTPLLLPASLCLLIRTSLAVTNDFSAYPSESQDCLYSSASTAGCTEGDTGATLNSCLCSNRGNFVYNTAKCVAKESPSDLETVYATLENNCAGTGNTIAVSHDAFMAQAAAATASTSTTATRTGSASATSSTTNPTNTADGLSTGAKIGIGAGIGFGAIAAILAGVFLWIYRRRTNQNKKYEQAQDQTPPTEYASTCGQPAQLEGTELSKIQQQPPPSPAADGGYYADPKKNSVQAGQPLLAELGNTGVQAPVELSAEEHPRAQYGQQQNLSPNPVGLPSEYDSQYSPSQYTPQTGNPSPTSHFGRSPI